MADKPKPRSKGKPGPADKAAQSILQKIAAGDKFMGALHDRTPEQAQAMLDKVQGLETRQAAASPAPIDPPMSAEERAAVRSAIAREPTPEPPPWAGASDLSKARPGREREAAREFAKHHPAMKELDLIDDLHNIKMRWSIAEDGAMVVRDLYGGHLRKPRNRASPAVLQRMHELLGRTNADFKSFQSAQPPFPEERVDLDSALRSIHDNAERRLGADSVARALEEAPQPTTDVGRGPEARRLQQATARSKIAEGDALARKFTSAADSAAGGDFVWDDEELLRWMSQNPDLLAAEAGAPEGKPSMAQRLRGWLGGEEGAALINRRAFLGRLAAGAAAAKGLAGAELPISATPPGPTAYPNLDATNLDFDKWDLLDDLGIPMSATDPDFKTFSDQAVEWMQDAILEGGRPALREEITHAFPTLAEHFSAESLAARAELVRQTPTMMDQLRARARLESLDPTNPAYQGKWALEAPAQAVRQQAAAALPEPAEAAAPRLVNALTGQPVPPQPGGRGPRTVGTHVQNPKAFGAVLRGENVGDVSRGLLSPANLASEVASGSSKLALRRLAALVGGEGLGAGLGFALMPDETTLYQHGQGTEDFITRDLLPFFGIEGLPTRSEMPTFSLAPERMAAVRDAQGMEGFRPPPEVLRARQGDAAYPDWGAAPITAEEVRLFEEYHERKGIPLPENWLGGVQPRRELPREWEEQPVVDVGGGVTWRGKRKRKVPLKTIEELGGPRLQTPSRWAEVLE